MALTLCYTKVILYTAVSEGNHIGIPFFNKIPMLCIYLITISTQIISAPKYILSHNQYNISRWETSAWQNLCGCKILINFTVRRLKMFILIMLLHLINYCVFFWIYIFVTFIAHLYLPYNPTIYIVLISLIYYLNWIFC